jgi:prepilin-type N-terminal cleavage/methylation domain-containing protein
MKPVLQKCFRNQNGFSLPELLIATFVLTIIFTGSVLVFIKTAELNEISSSMSTAMSSARNRVVQIEIAAFDSVYGNYHGVSFTPTGLTNSKGVTYVDNSNPELLVITTVVSWTQKNGRLFGEDADLDGNLDAGEDANGNGRLDSPVELTTERYDS